MAVTYKLEAFEGPLDLLLHLIDKAEIDIHEVSISEITDQYMDYLDAMQQLELEVTSEFLVMAATLLFIKSKQLLPKPPIIEDEFDEMWEEEGLDPHDELIAKLVEYRKYKQIAEQLRDWEQERSLVFTKEAEDLTPYMPVIPDNPVRGLHLDDLIKAFQKAMRKVSRRNIVATIHRDEISVKDRIRDIVDVLREYETVRFSKLIREEMGRHEIVVTFLALLELMKIKHIRCFQNQLFDDIVIHWRGEAAESGLLEIEDSY
ncbi:segregation and condensation protein A [Paenibacillus sp. GCM10027626]|uniref:segregation and condensation protein A n=1 Tax=Paenibacillus sp. GCM10027626 TaxID=3273411 RepID=UPI00363E42E1